MCGIAGIYFKKSRGYNWDAVEKMVDELVLGIESRGKDATGFVAITNKGKKAVLVKEPVRASLFVRTMPQIAKSTRMILLHTRWATQGSPTIEGNNHPVVYDSCYVTHNGHINNDEDLFKTYEIESKIEKDAIGQSVDSEIIPALIAKHGFDKINLALKELDGGFAIAVADPKNHPDELILAKGPNSPLKYFESETVLIWASEIGPIQKAWKAGMDTELSWNRVEDLREGELLWAKPGSIEKLDFPVYEDESKKPLGFTHHNLRQLPAGDKPKKQEPWKWGCKGCGHRYADHPSDKEKEAGDDRCSGSDRCHCRSYVSKYTRNQTGKLSDGDDFHISEIIQYVGVNYIRHGILTDGRLVRLDTLEVVDWPDRAGAMTWDLKDYCNNCDHTTYRHTGLVAKCSYPSCECAAFIPSPDEPEEGDGVEVCGVVVAAERSSDDDVGGETAKAIAKTFDDGDVESVIVKCDGCSELVDDDDTDVVNNWILCPVCFAAWQDMGGPTETEEEKEAQQEAEAQDSVEQLEREHVAAYEHWLRVCANDINIHVHCLNEVNANTGYHQRWVEWLMFLCPLDLLEDDDFLKQAKRECEELYVEAEETYHVQAAA